MRFKKEKHEIGDTRIRTFFAFLPIKIETSSYTETRWLEKVTVKEKVVEEYSSGYYGIMPVEVWKPVEFIELE